MHTRVVPELLRDQLPSSKRGPVGPAIRPDPQKLGRVSSTKIWFISERKKPKDPEAPTAAAPTNDTNGLVRKTTSVSSFHSALSELGIGPGPSATTESFSLPQLNQGTTMKPVPTIPASPTSAVPSRAIISRPFSQTPWSCRFLRKEIWTGNGFIPDSRLVDWMWSISTDTEHVIAILRFIPKITWHSDVGKILHRHFPLSSFNFRKKPRALIQTRASKTGFSL